MQELYIYILLESEFYNVNFCQVCDQKKDTHNITVIYLHWSVCLVLFCFVLQRSGGLCNLSCLSIVFMFSFYLSEHSPKSLSHLSVISRSEAVSSKSSFTTRLLNIPALSHLHNHYLTCIM